MDEERRRLFSAGLLDIASGVLRGKLDVDATADRLRYALKWIEAIGKDAVINAAPPKAGPTTADVSEVFIHWQTTTKRPRAKLTPERRKKIRARLCDFSVTDLKKLVSWASTEPFFQGENDRNTRYDTIECLFRSTERVESYMEKVTIGAGDGVRAKDRLVVRAEEALKGGDIDTYNAIQDELRSRRGNEKGQRGDGCDAP